MRLVAAKFAFFLISMFMITAANAQLEFPEDKVSWKFSVDQKGEDATIVGTITMDEHWHIYAANLPEGVFILPTEIKLKASPEYKAVGGVIEPKPKFEHDELTDEDLYYHDGTIKMSRKIKVLTDKDFKIKGTFVFQTCDDVKCLPPYSAEFTVNVKGVKKEESEVVEPSTNDEGQDLSENQNDEQTAVDDTTSNATAANDHSGNSDGIEDPEGDKDQSVWMIFLLSFASGFAALLTPCVFPMIPMTVSFFTKQSKTRAKGIRNAILYGLSIIIIYILLGTVITGIFGAGALNKMAAHPVFNIAFFALLVIFAISFLGAFEIRLPSKWVNSADSKADKGGIVGIFFMALVLALVSFSCTGPIVGTLLVKAAESGGLTPIIGMFGFSLALALPFALFAAFPGWMNSLPQSGGWLNTVKVVLGFLELALAFKFLQNADYALNAGYITREVFIAVWIGVFLVLALYLLGFFRMPHDSPVDKISVTRALLGTTSIIFVIYMLPGMWGAPLKLLAAFPPPKQYSESPYGVGGSAPAVIGESSEHVEGMHLGPQNIMVFDDYDLAYEHAQKEGKPLFVDFTGKTCVNCRAMEQSVWGEPGIIEHLKKDVVIVSLHVDDPKELPKKEQVEVTQGGRKKKLMTYGDKWMHMEISKYNITAQPYYVMIGPNGEDLSNGSASFETHSSPDDFRKWLNDGLDLFKKAKE